MKDSLPIRQLWQWHWHDGRNGLTCWNAGTEMRDVTQDDIQKLQFTERFIKETFRIYAPVPWISRVTSEPCTIGEKRRRLYWYSKPYNSNGENIPRAVFRSYMERWFVVTFSYINSRLNVNLNKITWPSEWRQTLTKNNIYYEIGLHNYLI